MDQRGMLSPENSEAVRERYEAIGPAAQTVTREVAKAMDFDRTEYAERVTSDVVGTARDALFASLLSVRVGTREEYDDWLAEHATLEERIEGSDSVENVAWHHVRADDAIAAVTFQNEPDAAVATVRRQAFGRHYRPLV